MIFGYSTNAYVNYSVKESLERIAALAIPHEGHHMRPLRERLVEEMNQHSEDNGFPVKPQKIIWDLRTVLELEDIVVCDVGAHKMWMARMFRCEYPNTCIISNGFASMGIAVPGAIAAKLVYPQRHVVAVTGDAGFMMNSQELETAVRLGLDLTVLIIRDDAYGMIKWKQAHLKFDEFGLSFGNPDFLKYAESYGAAGLRVSTADELLPALEEAFALAKPVLVECAIDYSENEAVWSRELGSIECHLE